MHGFAGPDSNLPWRKQMRKLLLAAALVVLPVVSALGAGNPWVGTWKLDLAKSMFTGDTFTYSKSANGLYHYSDGSTDAFDFGIDGKEYPAMYGQVVTWTADGDHAWNSVWKLKGKVLDNVHRQLSVDGKTLTITDSGTKPDGSTFHELLERQDWLASGSRRRRISLHRIQLLFPRRRRVRSGGRSRSIRMFLKERPMGQTSQLQDHKSLLV